MAHAMLSPSSASRWINCPPSALLQARLQDERSESAAEGTLAHKLADQMLSIDKYPKEMVEVCEKYKDFILSRVPPGGKLYVEEKLDLRDFVPECFGTCDALIIAKDYIEVIDFKYGQGVKVHAENNYQLMIYALGAYRLAVIQGLSDTIETIKMTIYQPRMDNISTHTISLDSLLCWNDNILKDAAEMAISGKGEPSTGPHCQFCKAKAVCGAVREDFEWLADLPDEIDDDQLAEVLDVAPRVKSFIKIHEEEALNRLMKGQSLFGWKLSAGRGKREIADKEAAIQAFENAGVSESEYLKKEILGFGALEGYLGKKRVEEIIGHLIKKAPGKPKIIKDNTSNDFNDFEED